MSGSSDPVTSSLSSVTTAQTLFGSQIFDSSLPSSLPAENDLAFKSKCDSSTIESNSATSTHSTELPELKQPTESVEKPLPNPPQSSTNSDQIHRTDSPPELGPFQYDLLPLDLIISRLAQTAIVDLNVTLDEMAKLPSADEGRYNSSPQDNHDLNSAKLGNLNRGTDDSHPTELLNASNRRKSLLIEYSRTQRDRFIQLLVLIDWFAHYGKSTQKLIDLVTWGKHTEAEMSAAIFSLGQLKVNMDSFKLPPPDLITAWEVLGSGQPNQIRWPDFGYTVTHRIAPEEVLKTLKQLNNCLQERIISKIGVGLAGLPAPLRSWRIKDGRVTFFVRNEFELDVSIASENADPIATRWWFVDLRWSFGPSFALPEFGIMRNFFESLINERLWEGWKRLVDGIQNFSITQEQASGDLDISNAKGSGTDVSSIPKIDRSCLYPTYEFLHNLILTQKVLTLGQQALSLSLYSGLWGRSIRIEKVHRVVVVQYWIGVPGAKNWIEFGVKSGKVMVYHRDRRWNRLEKNKRLGWDWRGRQASRFGVRWVWGGEEVSLDGLPGANALKLHNQERYMKGEANEWEWETELIGLGNLSKMDMDACLKRIVSIHSIAMFEVIRHRLIEPHRSGSGFSGCSSALFAELQVEQESLPTYLKTAANSAATVFRPKILLKFGNVYSSASAVLEYDPFSGRFGLSPPSRHSIHAAAALNKLSSKQRMAGWDVAAIVKSFLAESLGYLIEERAMAVAGWRIERSWRINVTKLTRLMGEALSLEHKRYVTGKALGTSSLLSGWTTAKLVAKGAGGSGGGVGGNEGHGGMSSGHNAKFGASLLRYQFLRPRLWNGSLWCLLCTISMEEAERWWAVEMTESLHTSSLRRTPEHLLVAMPTINIESVGSGTGLVRKQSSKIIFNPAPVNSCSQVSVMKDVEIKTIFPIYANVDGDGKFMFQPLERIWFEHIESIALGSINNGIILRFIEQSGGRCRVFPDGQGSILADEGFYESLASVNCEADEEDSGQSERYSDGYRIRDVKGFAPYVTVNLGDLMRGHGDGNETYEWLLGALKIQFWQLECSKIAEGEGWYSITSIMSDVPYVTYVVGGMFSRDCRLIGKLKKSRLDKGKFGDSDFGEFVHVDDKMNFSFFVRVKFGESCLEGIRRKIRWLGRLRVILIEAEECGLGECITRLSGSGIEFKYRDPFILSKLRDDWKRDELKRLGIRNGGGDERTYTLRLHLGSAAAVAADGEIEIEMDEDNPHKLMEEHLEQLFRAGGTDGTEKVRRGFHSLVQGLVLTFPVCKALLDINQGVDWKRESGSKVLMSKQDEKLAKSKLVMGMMERPVVHVRGVDCIRLRYIEVNLTIEMRLIRRKGAFEWLFGKVPGSEVGMGEAMTATAMMMMNTRMDHTVVGSVLQKLFTSKGMGWIGLRSGAIARLNGTEEFIRRLDWAIRSIDVYSIATTTAARSSDAENKNGGNQANRLTRLRVDGMPTGN